MEPNARQIAAVLGGVVQGNTVHAPTPGHSKRDRGTVVTLDPDAPDGCLVHSFNGGDPLAIKDQLRAAGALPERTERKRTNIEWRRAGAYVYDDGDGNPLYRAVRFEAANWNGGGKRPKDYRAERYEGGQWVSGLGQVDRLPYRFTELCTAFEAAREAGEPMPIVYFVEGEGKADKLAGWGLLATCIVGGSNGWREEYGEAFAGGTTVILPDNDAPGASFAETVRQGIEGYGGKAVVLDLPRLPPKGDIMDWDGKPDELNELTQRALAGEWERPPLLAATPFGWPDPASIPRRCWLFGYWLLRGEITAIVAPGGVGKSTFTTAVAVSMASGRDFLEKSLPEGALSVWLWNLEDGREELDRQVSACAMHHGIAPTDCGNRLYVDSGLDQRLCTATETADGVQIVEPVYEALKAEIERRGIDVLIVDPFVSSHEVDENMNAKVDRVAKRWKRLATETNCSIVLVHHTKKMGGREVKAEDSRGAVALINAARSTLVFNPMTREEAERFGITERADQRRHVRIDDDKPNRAPPESAWWMKLESVDLGNGDGLKPSDKVGAATPWSPPDPFDGLSVADLYAVQQAIDGGEWAHSVQANDWVGHAVADVLGLNVNDKTDKARIGSLLRGWIATESLVVERRTDPKKGREKPFVVVGKWVDPACLPTSKSGVGNVV